MFERFTPRVLLGLTATPERTDIRITMRKRTQQLLQKLALSVVTDLLCCGAAELALRLIIPIQTFVNPLSSFHQFDPELGWIGSPNMTARFRKVEFDVLVRSNAGGFRARNSTTQPSPGSPVVAVLGDSFTWGWGIENGNVFTDVMQNEVGAAADVRNLGDNAYGTLQELLLLQRCLTNGLHPQFVFVMLCRNDFYDNVGAEDRKPWLSVTGTNATVHNSPVAKRGISPFNRIVKVSRLLSTIAYVADFAKEKRRVKDLEQVTFEDKTVAETPREAMAFCLDRFKAVCGATDIRLWFVYVPTIADVQSETASQVRVTITTLCGEQGVRLLDLTDDFRQVTGDQPISRFFPHDGHWNAARYEIAGKRLAAALKQELSSAGPEKR